MIKDFASRWFIAFFAMTWPIVYLSWNVLQREGFASWATSSHMKLLVGASFAAAVFFSWLDWLTTEQRRYIGLIIMAGVGCSFFAGNDAWNNGVGGAILMATVLAFRHWFMRAP